MAKRRIINDKRSYYRNVYLLSEHWKNLRGEKLKINPICEKCGYSKRVDVHHLRYRNLYDVLVSDLQTLCRSCHKKTHGIIGNQDKFVKDKKDKRKARANKRRIIRRAAKSLKMSVLRFRELAERSKIPL